MLAFLETLYSAQDSPPLPQYKEISGKNASYTAVEKPPSNVTIAQELYLVHCGDLHGIQKREAVLNVSVQFSR